MVNFMKELICNADNIMAAINHYLAKANEDLEKTLKKEGYVAPKKTVEVINYLEEDIADILHTQTEDFTDVLIQADADNTGEEELKKRITEFLKTDAIAMEVESVTMDMFEVQIPMLANLYINESDGELIIENIRDRTYNWFLEWSEKLGTLTRINTHQQITTLIQQAISDGKSIDYLVKKIQEGGWRTEYYQARKFALTETLRAHSVAREESIQQSPAVDEKEWIHTGSHKNNPRENHVAMNGQIVPKEQPFELKGQDGEIYYPMYPRDPILPASESVNCHCIHRGIVNKDILGMSYEERKKMQEDFVNNDNEAWIKEQDAFNRGKAGITIDEKESSKPKYDTKASVINRKEIASANYRNRYNVLPETKKVQRRITSSAKKMLRHRSGSEYEDLAFIDSKTGTVMLRDNYNVRKQVIPSTAMKKMVKAADDFTIIAIHNHPTSSVPSLDDLRSAGEKKYKYGIVACHDGSIFKYHVPGDINAPMADGGLDMLERVKYINDEQERSELLGKALGILSESGVEMEVL